MTSAPPPTVSDFGFLITVALCNSALFLDFTVFCSSPGLRKTGLQEHRLALKSPHLCLTPEQARLSVWWCTRLWHECWKLCCNLEARTAWEVCHIQTQHCLPAVKCHLDNIGTGCTYLTLEPKSPIQGYRFMRLKPVLAISMFCTFSVVYKHVNCLWSLKRRFTKEMRQMGWASYPDTVNGLDAQTQRKRKRDCGRWVCRELCSMTLPCQEISKFLPNGGTRKTWFSLHIVSPERPGRGTAPPSGQQVFHMSPRRSNLQEIEIPEKIQMEEPATDSQDVLSCARTCSNDWVSLYGLEFFTHFIILLLFNDTLCSSTHTSFSWRPSL